MTRPIYATKQGNYCAAVRSADPELCSAAAAAAFAGTFAAARHDEVMGTGA